MTFLVDCLAVFRLTRLVTRDRITEPLRAKAETGPEWLRYLSGCAWCASPYVAVGVVLARKWAPGVWEPAARVLAFSAVTGLLAETVDG